PPEELRVALEHGGIVVEDADRVTLPGDRSHRAVTLGKRRARLRDGRPEENPPFGKLFDPPPRAKLARPHPGVRHCCRQRTPSSSSFAAKRYSLSFRWSVRSPIPSISAAWVRLRCVLSSASRIARFSISSIVTAGPAGRSTRPGGQGRGSSSRAAADADPAAPSRRYSSGRS